MLDLPSYPMPKQRQIIMACITDFDMCDQDENYVPMAEASSSSQGNRRRIRQGDEDQNMNQFRDWIVNGLFRRS